MKLCPDSHYFLYNMLIAGVKTFPTYGLYFSEYLKVFFELGEFSLALA
jgi:hypothetical protein